MIFGVTYYLEYTTIYIYTIDVNFCQVKLLIFCDVQTTDLTLIDKLQFQLVSDTKYNISVALFMVFRVTQYLE